MARMKYYDPVTQTWEYADKAYSPSKPGDNDFDLSEQVDRAETAAAAAEAAAARAEDAAERAEEAANGVGSGGNADLTIDGETLVIAENSSATIDGETLIL